MISLLKDARVFKVTDVKLPFKCIVCSACIQRYFLRTEIFAPFLAMI